MDATGPFELYRRLADTVSRQRAAALDGDWVALAALESECGRIIDALKKNDPGADLTVPEQKELQIILRKMVEDQQEIRKIAEEGRSQLAAQIKSIKTEQKLMQTYGLF
ncbi:flagellar protein FliT [Methylosarcina fibrata]|uniref:flagellar protein FliT n=1 Tax=Methylosarcina fibrata TaxID=105972 RepID=UPI0003741EE6|nr:flagellar protein FliT [Methylosarcina fibrata]